MKYIIKSFFKKHFFPILGLTLVVLGFAGVIIIEIVSGWTKETTIGVIYSVTSVLIGMVVGLFWRDFVISHNKEIRHARNKVFRSLEELDKKNGLHILEDKIVNKENSQHLEEINTLLMSSGVVEKEINVGQLYLLFSYENPNRIDTLRMSFIVRMRVSYLFERIKKNYSKKYESMYASYKSLELVRTSGTNFFTVTLSFIFSLIALFAVIYQALSNDESLKQPLIDYIWVFFTFFVFSFTISVFYTDAFIKEEIEKQKKNMEYISETIKDINLQ